MMNGNGASPLLQQQHDDYDAKQLRSRIGQHQHYRGLGPSGSSRQPRSRVCKNLWFWLLVPGNLIAIFLLFTGAGNVEIQQKQQVVVYRHVYHTSPQEVWKVSNVDGRSASSQTRLNVRDLNAEMNKKRKRIAQVMEDDDQEKDSELAVRNKNFETMYLFKKTVEELEDEDDEEEEDNDEEEQNNNNDTYEKTPTQQQNVANSALRAQDEELERMEEEEAEKAVEYDEGIEEENGTVVLTKDEREQLEAAAAVETLVLDVNDYSKSPNNEDNEELVLEESSAIHELKLEDDDEDEELDDEDDDDDDLLLSVQEPDDNYANLPIQVRPLQRKTFANFRTSTCSYLCEQLKKKKWKLVPKSPSLLLIRWHSYDKYRYLKRSIINHVGSGSACIGGGKGHQLKCRQDFARENQCDYNQLQIQPLQWNLQHETDCKEFFEYAEDHETQLWIKKKGGSFHGRGIKILNGTDGVKTYRSCKKKLREGIILQSYISSPVLMGGHKFDLRTYLLVASTNPFLVFYHDGFIRRSEKKYLNASSSLTDVKVHITNNPKQSTENHFFGFAEVEQMLFEEHGFPQDFLRNEFKKRAVEVTNFLFHSAKIEQRKGRFQLFALDWMVDTNRGIHLLEANGDPSIVPYPGIGLTPDIWTTMLDLVYNLHTAPKKLKIPKTFDSEDPYRYHGWELTYNEVAENAQPVNEYNPCTIFI